MTTVLLTVDINDEHKLTLTLPNEVPPGKAKLHITIEPLDEADSKKPRTSLADWAEENAESWWEKLDASDVESFTGRRF